MCPPGVGVRMLVKVWVRWVCWSPGGDDWMESMVGVVHAGRAQGDGDVPPEGAILLKTLASAMNPRPAVRKMSKLVRTWTR